MKLSALLERIEYTCCQGDTEQEISSVIYDSRKAGEGSLFICIKGARSLTDTNLSLMSSPKA